MDVKVLNEGERLNIKVLCWRRIFLFWEEKKLELDVVFWRVLVKENNVGINWINLDEYLIVNMFRCERLR